MKFKRYSVNFALSYILACVIIIGTTRVIAQSKPSQINSEAKLTSTQLKVLYSLGLKIALPSYIPANFRTDKVLVEAGRDNVQGLRYLVVYRNLNAGKCFAIESVSGGSNATCPPYRAVTR
jgi:hypothetical protein